MSKIVGGCLCGEVRYESLAEPVMQIVCHCKNCQKQTGAAASPLVGIPRTQFEVNRDALSSYTSLGDSGLSVQRFFCGKCGSPIYSELAMLPELTFVKAGTLDDGSWLNPTLNVWCDSAAKWTVFAGTAVKIPQNPPMI